MAIGKILTVVRQLFGADVQVSAPSNGEVLQYNGTTKRWANAAAAGGSSLTGNPDVTISATGSGGEVNISSAQSNLKLSAGSDSARIQIDPINVYIGSAANVEGDNTGTTTLNCGQTGSLKFQVFGTTILETTTDYGLRMPELGVDPAAPAANCGVFFMRDNGAGKTQFCVRFSSGAVQVIATQP